MSNFDKNRFCSNKQEYETPVELFSSLNKEFNFDIDLAANDENHKCEKWFGYKNNIFVDALEQDWRGVCWLNPPYGSKKYKIGAWIKKAYYASIVNDTTIVMLIPARTNTKWWHKFCMNASEIRFILGRPKFKGCKYGLPQPLAIVIFKRRFLGDEKKISSLAI
jgi:phage N-6-adenine-methyltransferase